MKIGIYDLEGKWVHTAQWISDITGTDKSPKKPCIALAGAGGKTSLLYYLAGEGAKSDKKVLVTTSTHIYAPEEKLAAYSMQQVRELWLKGLPAVIGTSEGEKWSAPAEDFLKQAVCEADLILVEADGSKGRPCKYKRAHEPVIWEQVSRVVAVVGLSALGQKISEAAYPPMEAAEYLKTNSDHEITNQDLACLVEQYKMYQPVVVINQVDTDRDMVQATKLACLIREKWGAEIYLSCMKEDSVTTIERY